MVGETDTGAATVDDLCFTARALAQTHPMTPAAHRYRQSCFDAERTRQPVTELADWASTALLVGYCVRRVEETESATTPPNDTVTATEPLAARARSISESLRTGDADGVTLLTAPTVVAALDTIIATELDKRRDHLREQMDDEAWSELEDYISWWVVHGYALRAAEAP